MRILLVYPPDSQLMFAVAPPFLRQADSSRRQPPLGLLYIAANLLDKTNHEVEILDTQIENLSYDEIENHIRRAAPDIIGIGTFTLTFLDALEIARRAKNVNPSTFVVMGGHHASIYPAETAALENVDAVVVGEGEHTMVELAEAISKGMPLSDVAGLCLHSPEGPVMTQPRGVSQQLDSLPFPARHLLPKDAYRFATDAQSCSTSMISSRGCRFRCVYCDVPHRSIRARSSQNVVSEIASCIEMGIGEINFYDDNFNFDEQRVIEIAKDIVERNLDIRFSIRGRVDKVTPEMLKWLAKAGCRRINLGIEAADDETLKTIKKGITVDMARQAIRLCKEAGIEVAAYFMTGLPGQTREQVQRTVDFAIEAAPDYAQFMYMVLLPATEVYRNALAAGAFEKDFYLEFARSPKPSDIIAYWQNPLPFNETLELTKKAFRQFYLRPSYLFKQLLKLRSAREFVKKAHGGYMVLSYAIHSLKDYVPQPIVKKERL